VEVQVDALVTLLLKVNQVIQVDQVVELVKQMVHTVLYQVEQVIHLQQVQLKEAQEELLVAVVMEEQVEVVLWQRVLLADQKPEEQELVYRQQLLEVMEFYVDHLDIMPEAEVEVDLKLGDQADQAE
jgi:hypothetical protein